MKPLIIIMGFYHLNRRGLMARKRVKGNKKSLKDKFLDYTDKKHAQRQDERVLSAEEEIKDAARVKSDLKKKRKFTRFAGAWDTVVPAATVVLGATALGLKGVNWYNDKKQQKEKDIADRNMRMWSVNNTKQMANDFRNPKNKEAALDINRDRLKKLRKKYKGL
jgi:hypothetical protein